MLHCHLPICALAALQDSNHHADGPDQPTEHADKVGLGHARPERLSSGSPILSICFTLAIPIILQVRVRVALPSSA